MQPRGRSSPGLLSSAGLASMALAIVLCSDFSARAGLFDNSPGSSRTDKPKAAAAAIQQSLPPSDAEYRPAVKQINQVLSPKLQKARLPAEKIQLVSEIMGLADSTAELTTKFALLRKAEDLSLDAADADGAMRAHQFLALLYKLGSSKEPQEFFQRAFRFGQNPADAARWAQLAGADAEAALGEAQYESARQLVRLASNWNKRSNDSTLAGRFTTLSANIDVAEMEQKRITPALATLAKNPGDVVANVTVGSFRCFYKNDWPAGLPLLAKGNIAMLKMLAEKEIAVPAQAQQQLELADGWWNYSDSQPPAAKNAIRTHAGMWYAKASPSLGGPSKIRADQRAAEFAHSTQPGTPAATQSSGG